jgi:membrane protein insertase Oxa1/YidC/SpoIIIJ
MGNIINLVLLYPISNLFTAFYETFFSVDSIVIGIIAFSLALSAILFPIKLYSSIGKEERLQIEKSMQSLETHYVNDVEKKKKLQRAILADHLVSLILSAISFLITITFFFAIRYLLKSGIGETETWLYTIVEKPDFNLGPQFGINPVEINVAFAAFTSILLFVSLSLSQIDSPFYVTNGDKTFRYIFPFLVFLVIRNDPAGVGFFILTGSVLNTLVILIKLFIRTTARVLKPPSLDVEIAKVGQNDGEEREE